MAELILKAVNYGAALKAIYGSCINTLLPIIIDYRKGVISSKWTYFKMMVKETYVILLEAGVIQLLEHIIVTFVCPGVGHIIVSIINMVATNKAIESLEKQIHQELDKY
jgi:large-conductance mechanosensitive channel